MQSFHVSTANENESTWGNEYEHYEHTFTHTYRVTMVVSDLGWVALDLKCSAILLRQEKATAMAHKPEELPKFKSVTTIVTL